MKVIITNYNSDGTTKFPHGLEAQILMQRTDPDLGTIHALAYVSCESTFSKGAIVPLFNEGAKFAPENERPWVINGWYSFSPTTPEKDIGYWLDLLTLQS